MPKQHLSRPVYWITAVISFIFLSSACVGGADAGSGEETYLPLVTKPGSPAPQIAGCDLFPTDNVWNTPIDHLPVHANSANYIATIGASTGLHADFGSDEIGRAHV